MKKKCSAIPSASRSATLGSRTPYSSQHYISIGA
jgi:hypothetical protein